MAEISSSDTNPEVPAVATTDPEQKQPEPVTVSAETGLATDHEERDANNNPTFNIYVADLPPDATDEDLLDAFKACGPIHSAQVVKDKLTGQSKRYGFVNFQTEDARDAAITNARALVVKGSTPRAFKSDSKNTLFIGNLPVNIGSSDLRVYLEKEGGVEIQSLILKPGYCFVTYTNFRQAEKAAAALKGRTINGMLIKVQLAMSKEKKVMLADGPPNAPADNLPRTLYIRNISESVSEESLRNVFSPFGSVVKCSLVKNFSYGFVEFSSHPEAAAALEATNSMDLEGKLLIVEFARTPSGQRGRRSERGRGGGPPYAHRGPPPRGGRYDDGYGRDRYGPYDSRSYSPPPYHHEYRGRGPRPPPREYDRYGPAAPYPPYYDDRYAPPPYPAWPTAPAAAQPPPAAPPTSVSSYLSALSAYAPTLSQLAAANSAVPPGPAAPQAPPHPAYPPPYPGAYGHYGYGDEYASRRDRPGDRYAPY